MTMAATETPEPKTETASAATTAAKPEDAPPPRRASWGPTFPRAGSRILVESAWRTPRWDHLPPTRSGEAPRS